MKRRQHIDFNLTIDICSPCPSLKYNATCITTSPHLRYFVNFPHCFSRYLFCCSYAHNVAPQGKFIAFVSAEAETDNPEIELKPGIDLLGPVDEIFYETYDRYVPINTMKDDNCFISTVSICMSLTPFFSLCLKRKRIFFSIFK